MTAVETPSLFDLPPATPSAPRPGRVHRNGHDTEHAAAARNPQRRAAIRVQVLEAIARAGDEGRTDVEVEAELGLDRPSGSNRRGELAADGLVEASGRTRLTPTGCPAKVWVLTEAGRRALSAVAS